MFEEDDEKLERVVREKLGRGRGEADDFEGEDGQEGRSARGGRDIREIVEGWEMWRP